MSNNCFIVTARPTDQTKFDMMVNCLKTLRQVTDDMIILSLNYLPTNLEEHAGSLYDSLVYSNVNESYDVEECTLNYAVHTPVFSLSTDYSNTEYGRAANNLRVRAYKVAQTFGKSEFVFLDYDCFLGDKNFIKYLSEHPALFLQGKNSSVGDPLVESYFFKLNNDTVHILDFFSNKERYFDYMNLKETKNVLFYEAGLYRYLAENNMLQYVVDKFNLHDFDIHLDTNFSEFRAFELDGQIWLCIEYLANSHPIFVEFEYNGVKHELGDTQGKWHLRPLGPYYEGMEYKATVNGESHIVKITPDSYKNTKITFV